MFASSSLDVAEAELCSNSARAELRTQPEGGAAPDGDTDQILRWPPGPRACTLCAVPGMADKLSIIEREVGDVTVLTLAGQILLDDGDLALRQSIHDLVARGRIKVVLDLADVTYIDSAGIGMIAGKLKTLRERGGDLKLLRLKVRGQRLLGTMKLLIIFETFDAEDMAVKSYEFKVR